MIEVRGLAKQAVSMAFQGNLRVKEKKKIRAAVAKEVGMGNPAEKTSRNPNREASLEKFLFGVNKKSVATKDFS
jgi:hypothetical protein